MNNIEIIDNIIFNIKEKHRKKIYNIFNDYDEYITREKEILKNETSEEKKLYIIINMAEAYYNNGKYKKAIQLTRLLDDYELNDTITFIYYVNLLLFYICYNEEDYVDYIYEESKDIINKFDSKYPEIVDLYKVRYLNFKGRYKESIQIIENDRIKNKNTDDFNLLLADIAFNTNKINQGIYIVSKLCKNYYQKNICIQNSIDVLINTYIGNINIEKGGQDNGFSSEKNMWNKVKTSKEKTLLLLIYIEIAKLFKKKWFIYGIMPLLITLFLTKAIIPVILGKSFKDVLINIIVFMFLSYYLLGFGYLSVKYKEKINSPYKHAFIILFIVINLLMGFFALDVLNNVRDLKYAIAKTDVKDSGVIRNIAIENDKKYSSIDIKINKKVFTIYENEQLYDYIKNNLKNGNKVNIEYLPNSMKLINIEKQ